MGTTLKENQRIVIVHGHLVSVNLYGFGCNSVYFIDIN